MSTTDPSAAKSDGFAIGSISKPDRSGSGDKAAPVYPVKHPKMSYAGAAKGRPAAQTNRLNTMDKKYNILVKEQAGLRTREECVGDFNMDKKQVLNWIRKLGIGLQLNNVTNSKGSRRVVYIVLNKQCIRHLTMSTTDPSAAKPDGFAIGSISKRDRSGSGDEATPVNPVKHPTISYAGAAKGRPAAQ
ncbi:hypothetical protein BB560_004904, partial [Smittium megazygosporum]